jgi:hypothetical protein
MGKLDLTCTAPHHVAVVRARRGVAAQVAFERQTLKPGNQFIGSRVETRRLSSYGSTLKANFETSFSLDRLKG